MTLRGPSQARWYKRLFWEAGLVRVTVMPLPVPDGTSAVGRKVAGGFGLLLAIRHEDGPAPFAPGDFTASWCELEPWQVRAGVTELRKAGVMELAGKHGPMNLYLPGSVAGEQRRVA